MADRVLPGPVGDSTCINEAVCIHTRKIFDSCRDKDCIEDLRVYPTISSQNSINCAFSVRPHSAELLLVKVNVEEISFNRGYFTVDVTFFYRVTGETFPGNAKVTGLAIFDKRVMLFGSESSAKVFSSSPGDYITKKGNQPVAVVEAVDPINLGMKIVDTCCCHCDMHDCRDIPAPILAAFGEDLLFGEPSRALFATLGQFSIIRLERDTQLVIPVYDYCIPEKECVGSSEEDPCTLFSRINFPIDEFFPPTNIDNTEVFSSADCD